GSSGIVGFGQARKRPSRLPAYFGEIYHDAHGAAARFSGGGLRCGRAGRVFRRAMKTDSAQISHLQSIARLIRYYCLNATSAAHSGHLTSSLSAADLMTGLLFGGTFRFNVVHPEEPNNDRLLFSKGHASPLFYALWTVAG